MPRGAVGAGGKWVLKEDQTEGVFTDRTRRSHLAYMGPPDKQPPLPDWEFAMVPASHSFMSKRFQECNWLQAMEGGIDSSHVSFLHRGELNKDPLFKGSKGNQYNLSDSKPH